MLFRSLTLNQLSLGASDHDKSGNRFGTAESGDDRGQQGGFRFSTVARRIPSDVGDDCCERFWSAADRLHFLAAFRPAGLRDRSIRSAARHWVGPGDRHNRLRDRRRLCPFVEPQSRLTTQFNDDEELMSTQRSKIALRLITLVTLSFGCSGVAGADARHGQEYSERWCSQCHGVQSGQASPDPKAPSFSDLATNPSTTRHSLTVSLRTTPHWTMPKIKPKSADINDVVSYILSLRTRH